MSDPAVQIDHLTHSYRAARRALDDVSLLIQPREIFGFLGPNGSGKTTLFRILCTLLAPESGRVTVLGHDVVTARERLRREIGVVFQSPSLDKQLTAEENLRHHGHLYGLRGAELASRANELLAALGLGERAGDRVGRFSGGMRRRVELAKCMLTRPRVLLLDEPSTGLDPSARSDLWSYLTRVRAEQGVTVLLTTHLMDEADDCDRIAVLDRGKLLASDSPATLKSTIGGDVITLDVTDPAAAADLLRRRLTLDVTQLDDDGALRLEHRDGHQLVPRIIESLPEGMVHSVSVGRPTLQDVFVRLTGHRFRQTEAEPDAGAAPLK